jgi:hypothetical protein
LTIEDLRRLPGAEKYSDEELEALWEEASKPPVQRPYKIYDGDKEVSDLSKMTAEQLLNATFGYSANKKEQRRNFEQLIRVAQLGHHDEARLNQLLAERNDFHKRWQDSTKELEGKSSLEKKWNWALEQLANGNADPIQQMANAFAEKLRQPPEETESEAPQSQAQIDAQGAEVYYGRIVPALQAIAKDYGAKAEEIKAVFDNFLNNEPEDVLTEQKIADFIDIQIPRMLEDAGYRVGGIQPPSDTPNELEQLRKENAELKAKQKNGIVKGIKEKSMPSGGGGRTPSAGDTVPEFKSAREAKDWLRT